MQELATYFRFMQLYAHNSHNLVTGPTFFEDHEYLGELYPAYEAAYDSLIERMIGLGKPVDLVSINRDAVKTLAEAGAHGDALRVFEDILHFEKFVCHEIEKILPEYSEGTKQMLGNICDQSEMRQYKLKQRTAK